MLDKNPRINVTFDRDMVVMLTKLARKKNTSMSNLVRELTYEALEFEEDICLSKLAEKLDKIGAKTYSHDAAWK